MVAVQDNQQEYTNQWLASAFRLTAFPVEPVVPPRAGLWSQLTGEEPDILTYRKSLELQEAGTHAGKVLNLTATPALTEWRLITPESEVLEDSKPGIPLKEGFDIFLPLMYQWIDHYSTDLQRIAFGMETYLLTSGRNETLQKLAEYIPVQIKPDTTNDFLYQINRKRDAVSVPDLKINRLSRWTPARIIIGFQQTGVEFDLPGLERYACRLELDINTSPDFQGILTRDVLRVVFDELVTLGEEITEKGDIE